MKRIIPSIFLGMLLATSFVHADETINVDGKLTAEQKAALALEAAKLVTANKNADAGPIAPPTTTVDTVKKWADIGTAIGGSLAASAKELGVAANDFAQSPVGKVTMAIIVWHFIGAQLVHIVFGALWFITMIPLWIYFYRRDSSKKTITYYEPGKGPDGAKKVVVRAPTPFSNDNDYRNGMGACYIISLILIVLIGLFATFSF